MFVAKLRSEAEDMINGGKARALDYSALPQEDAVLKFLQSAFTESEATA